MVWRVRSSEARSNPPQPSGQPFSRLTRSLFRTPTSFLASQPAVSQALARFSACSWAGTQGHDQASFVYLKTEISPPTVNNLLRTWTSSLRLVFRTKSASACLDTLLVAFVTTRATGHLYRWRHLGLDVLLRWVWAPARLMVIEAGWVVLLLVLGDAGRALGVLHGRLEAMGLLGVMSIAMRTLGWLNACSWVSLAILTGPDVY